MVNRSLLAFTLLTAATAAHAQTPDTTAPPTTGATAGDPYQKGTLGLVLPVALSSSGISVAGLTSEPVPTVGIMYFLDPKAALDIVVGINLHKEQMANPAMPMMTSDKTLFGFAAGLGYRMYKHMDKLHSFIEPQLTLGWADTSASATFALRVAGYFGAERVVTDWFSFSGAIGAGLGFTNSFKDIQLSTTALLAANFYWK